MSNFQIEQINYELIRSASGLSFVEKNILLGNPNKYVATQKTENGLLILTQTIGKRDQCIELLKKWVEQTAEVM